VPQLELISRATTKRTGGCYTPISWRQVMELSRRHPDRSRLIGTFLANSNSSDALLAFAWGCHHGEYAHYEAGGSVRRPGFNTPLSYALLWDLIRWAKVNKAMWFDLGGTTTGNHASARLAGISEMKRYFSGVEARVGEEWVYNPSPQLAHMETLVGNLVRRLRG
jgi:lipid II:glycine glycyltransferase (peptidoglycan interpeptide bridge formation enzyme)